jgi:tight adherence protein B
VLASLAIALVGGALYAFHLLATRLPERRIRRRVDRRLRGMMNEDVQLQPRSVGVLFKTERPGPLPGVDRLVSSTTHGSALERWIAQAGSQLSVSALLMSAAVAGAIAATIASFVSHRLWVIALAFLVGAAIPLVRLRRQRRKRLNRFEEQFPEALDLISRAVRAGHAFNTGLKMVADETGDPVGPEFRTTFDEQNFGLPLKDALANLSDRVPILDVRFFCTAVLIQRETGGNLAEVLDNLANIVRERFKILRQVRVHTAHGRLTGYVLLALPVALVLVLQFINPEHTNVLFTDPIGKTMLVVTMVMQIIGYFWIKKVIKIEV